MFEGKLFTNRFVDGKTFVIADTIDYTQFIECEGGKVDSVVDADTDYLVCDESNGPEVDKARELGITVLTKEEFIQKAIYASAVWQYRIDGCDIPNGTFAVMGGCDDYEEGDEAYGYFPGMMFAYPYPKEILENLLDDGADEFYEILDEVECEYGTLDASGSSDDDYVEFDVSAPDAKSELEVAVIFENMVARINELYGI